MPEFRTLRVLPIAVVTAVLAACAVGPNYVRPEVPVPDRFARDAAMVDGEVAAVVVATPDADAEFWAGFDDPMLTRLVEAALLANPHVPVDRGMRRAPEDAGRSVFRTPPSCPPCGLSD